ncbi:MAG TPA: copper homeostasis protein CutC [Rhodobacteraceae bacterium]|nr:copper homeostasis protein CutC [Paracoccaceae bacterium]
MKLEICVDTIEGAVVASKAGAHRVELCAALSEGGLTPSVGLMAAAAQLDTPVYSMIRPRAGGFCYTQAELAIMKQDIEASAEAGCDGVVFGVLLPDGQLDKVALAGLLRASVLPATLHRAFDCVPDPFAALEQAIDLGFERILTSGGQASALEGLNLIAELVKRAAGRIAIMPGAGVNAGNVGEIVSGAGVTEVHSSCASSQEDQGVVLPNDAVQKATDPAKIRAILEALEAL